MFKKLTLSFLTALVLITSLFATPVHAQATWYNQDFYEWYRKVYDTDISPQSDIFGERYTAAQVQWIAYSIPSLIINFIFQGNEDAAACLLGLIFTSSGSINNCKDMIFITANGSQTQFYAQNKDSKSVVQKILEDRPLSGITYVKNKLRKFNLVPEAQAQGFGFTTALEPFQDFWRVSRDMVYSLFVIATIIMAFMIMFRVKLSPQVVINVQSAIPKIVIGLILVTFSYAIAGFLVDLMYVVIGIVSLFFARAINSAAGTSISSGLIFDFMTTGPQIPGAAIPLGIWGLIIMYIIMFGISALVVISLSLGLVITSLTTILGVILFFSPVGIIGALLILILIIGAFVVVFVFAFKTIWMLLKTFVNVILATIIAPFQILIGLFYPSMGFAVWMRNFISNLSVFIVAGSLFIMSYLFLIMSLNTVQSSAAESLSSLLFGTTLTGIFTGSSVNGWPPLLSPASEFLGFLYLGVSFVIFTMIPKAAELVKSLLAGKPFAYGTGVGEMLAPAAAAGMLGGQLASTAQQQQYQRYQAHLRAGGAPLRGPETMQALGQALRQLFPKIK